MLAHSHLIRVEWGRYSQIIRAENADVCRSYGLCLQAATPIMVLGRLAVDLAWQRRSLGRALLRDAILRTVQVSEIVGVKALLVHALSDQAVRFYEANGFYPSPTNPRTLFLPLSEV